MTKRKKAAAKKSKKSAAKKPAAKKAAAKKATAKKPAAKKPEFPVLTIGSRQVPTSAIDEPDTEARAALETLFANPAKLDQTCRAALVENARVENDGAARLYVTHHLAELDGLAARFAVADPEHPSLTIVETFLSSMYVRSIWSSPESEDAFLHVDYTIDDRGTQYVLSVATDRRGTVSGVEMES